MSQSNHLTLSLISKGILGGSIGLVTKGILSNLINVEIITKQKKRGNSDYYDSEYWKRFNRELEESGDEIDIINIKVRKKYITEKYHISAELINQEIKVNLIKDNIIQEKYSHDISINIELIDDIINDDDDDDINVNFDLL